MSTTVPTEPGSAALGSTDLGDPSVFDMLNVLRRRLFVNVDELRKNILIATKDDKGQIDWVTLSPAYHGTLVKTALVLVLRGVLNAPLVPLVKRTLFVYILELLNEGKDTMFFALSKGATTHNRAQREKKRLARKRSRAAKREEQRIVKKGGHVQVALKRGQENVLTCPDCALDFRSRKQQKKHTCKKAVKSVVEPTIAPTNSTLPPAVTVPSPVLSSVPIPAPVPDPSPEPAAADLPEVVLYARWAKDHGVTRVCEDCVPGNQRQAEYVLIHGAFETSAYLKCCLHMRNRGEDLIPLKERW
ncbi:hypothetical protein DFH29DRAFT_996871 [Suillus ampliporus]|nr:hypothetical protein DFH29DRAFT_996871 [Suillus ampliporus]